MLLYRLRPIRTFRMHQNGFSFSIEYNALGQWQLRRIVQCNRGSFAILFPCIRTRLAATTCMLLTAKCTANFYSKRLKMRKTRKKTFYHSFWNVGRKRTPTGTRWRCIDVNQSAIRTVRTNPLEKPFINFQMIICKGI